MAPTSSSRATRSRVRNLNLPLMTSLKPPKRAPKNPLGPNASKVTKSKKKGRFNANIKDPKTLTDLVFDSGTASFERGFTLDCSHQKVERQKWPTGKRKAPITDPAKVPEGWNANEPDLRENDFEAQIVRCKERIREGILPDFFQKRLDRYRAMRERNKKMRDSEPGLSENIAMRLKTLEHIHAHIEQHGDKGEYKASVEAIMAAYRSGKLKEDTKSVSYWAKGKLVAGPKEQNMEELYELWEKHGPKGFWVESMADPNPIGKQGIVMTQSSLNGEMSEHAIKFSCMSPLARETRDSALGMEFVYDTGATWPFMWEGDIEQIAYLNNRSLPHIGLERIQRMQGHEVLESVTVRMNVHHQQQEMFRWVDVRVCIYPGDKPDDDSRLSGCWIRHMVFMVTIPDNKLKMYVSNDMTTLSNNLPSGFKPADAQPPPIWYSWHPKRQNQRLPVLLIPSVIPTKGIIPPNPAAGPTPPPGPVP